MLHFPLSHQVNSPTIMSKDITIPAAGESINTASIGAWHFKDGDEVNQGDVLATIETDKVSNELEAEVSGTLKILVGEGEEVDIGALIGRIEESASSGDSVAEDSAEDSAAASNDSVDSSKSEQEFVEITVPAAGESINTASIGAWNFQNGEKVEKGNIVAVLETDKVSNELEAEADGTLEILVAEGEEVEIGALIGRIKVGDAGAGDSSGAPRKAKSSASDDAKSSKAADTQGSGSKNGSAKGDSRPSQASSINKPDLSLVNNANTGAEAVNQATAGDEGRVTRRKMSMLRRKIAQHLVNAQQTAAILTTFNEVDMSAVMQLRKDVQEDFIKKHGCKLGFMSLFVKAVVQALKDVPQINGMIDGNEVIENHFYDIGVAVGTEKGLVVPVLRDCDQKSFAQIEKDILDYAEKAKNGSIQIEDLQGGVFTISNGGVYGSLLSTPILNPPQSGILGMHTIQQRPVAVNGQVEIRPMMYLALSYDHRLVDGKEAVTFLIRIKDVLENPARLMLEV